MTTPAPTPFDGLSPEPKEHEVDAPPAPERTVALRDAVSMLLVASAMFVGTAAAWIAGGTAAGLGMLAAALLVVGLLVGTR